MNYDMNRLQSERESLNMISLQLDQTLADVEKLMILKTLPAIKFTNTITYSTLRNKRKSIKTEKLSMIKA